MTGRPFRDTFNMDLSQRTTEQIIRELTLASEAYYNRDEILMSDEMYDTLKEELERRNPDHPFLKQVGAPEKDAVPLPYAMPSLRKIKFGKGDVARFGARRGCSSWVLSEKLDGISALWNGQTRQLWLRGDGLAGPLVSHLVPHIRGLQPSPHTIRGELLVADADVEEGVLPRSWVNGLLHKLQPGSADLAKLRFLAYEIVSPCTWTREQQLTWFNQNGFQTPWYSITSQLDDRLLSDTFQTRRKVSPFSLDGIVVGENSVPLRQQNQKDVSLPKDMVAFKMPLTDQQAITTIVEVEWNTSHQGYFIPKLQVEPVVIQGSRIQYLTGHNARCIVDNKLGKGAKICIRKGGDVIPTLDSVLEPAVAICFPPEGTWEWVGEPETATHIRTKTETPEILAAKLVHFAKTLELPWLAVGNIRKVVESGRKTVRELVAMTESDWKLVLGTVLGKKAYDSIQEIGKTGRTEMELMVASSTLPRGVGETKLQKLFEKEADPRLWRSSLAGATLPGWSTSGLQEFLAAFPVYEAWRQRELPGLPYPLGSTPAAKPSLFLCFTGFRSSDLETAAKKKSFEVQDSVTAKTNLLIVKDLSALQKPTEKVKKAQEKGIRVLTREHFEKEYLS